MTKNDKHIKELARIEQKTKRMEHKTKEWFAALYYDLAKDVAQACKLIEHGEIDKAKAVLTGKTNARKI